MIQLTVIQVDITGPVSTEIIGQTFPLSLKVVPADLVPAIPYVIPCSWTIPGSKSDRVETFQIIDTSTAQTGTAIDLTSNDKNYSPTSLYWLTPGAKQISCTATIAGTVCQPEAVTYTIVAPTASISGTPGTAVAYNMFPGHPGWWLQIVNDSSNDGQAGYRNRYAVTSMPANFTGNWTWIQLVTGSTRMETENKTPTNIVWSVKGANFPAVDTTTTYPSLADGSMADSPAIPINPFTANGQSSITDVKDAVMTDQFQDWLMFTPTSGGKPIGIAVPIQKLSWGYSAHAAGGGDTWNATQTAPQKATGTATTTFPEWKDNITSNKWQHQPFNVLPFTTMPQTSYNYGQPTLHFLQTESPSSSIGDSVLPN